MGYRGFHKFVSRAVGEVPLPAWSDAGTARGYSAWQIQDLRSGARYFAYANFWRGIMHLPVVGLFVWRDVWGLAALFLALAAGHAQLVLLELYKASVIWQLQADPEAKPVERADMASSTAWDWFFKPKKFETEAFYRGLGLGWFRILATRFIEWSRLSPEERARGDRPEYVGRGTREDVARFESATRVGEAAHWVMGFLDAIPIVFCIVNGIFWPLPYLIWIWWGDTWLALLQRQHRCRVWKLVERVRKRQASGGQVEKEPAGTKS